MIQNQVEHHVTQAYQALQQQVAGFCGCELCRADVLVYALNRLPARYVASREGTIITELDLDGNQMRARIEVVVLEGLRQVAAHRRCDGKGRSLTP
ncbi:MAG: late competence development ComFB family protein [Gemmatimonadota bacterium]|nr:late competence development ComFB family protein [Gemmatimonadota bacterium]